MTTPAKIEPCLHGVDFDDTKVIVAIQRAANKPLSKKQLERLAQFETKPSGDALLQWVD